MGGRHEKRVSKRLRVFFGTEANKYYEGAIKDVSIGGLGITSPKLYRAKTILNIILEADGKPLRMKGEVAWVSRRAIQSNIKSDMGIKLINAPEEYTEFFNQVSDELAEMRGEPRIAKVFKVTFNHPRELVEKYTLNISRTGMFIASTLDVEIGSHVEIKVELADVNKMVYLTGEIMYRVSEEDAKKKNTEAGFGLRIVRFFGHDKDVFLNYINSFFLEND